MSAGWVNLKARADRVRAQEKLDRESGYSDGYALRVAKSFGAVYQQSWRRGRAARRAFDAGEGAA